jgi:hypothetical protein
MPCVNTFGQRCDRVLRLHVRQVNHVAFDIHQSLQRAQRIYGKYGIFVQVSSIQGVQMPLRDVSRLSSVETECNANESSPEQAELFARFGVQDFASVTVFLVQTLPVPAKPPRKQETAPDGCAGHAPHRPAVYLTAFVDNIVLAHELGHVLIEHSALPEHHTEGDRHVMRSGADEVMTIKDPTFSIRQLEAIRRSPFLLPC